MTQAGMQPCDECNKLFQSFLLFSCQSCGCSYCTTCSGEDQLCPGCEDQEERSAVTCGYSDYSWYD